MSVEKEIIVERRILDSEGRMSVGGPAQAHSLHRPGSAPCLVVTQDLVNEIIERARASRWGLDTAKCDTSLDHYAETDEHAMAMLLVNGWEAKYDLVSLFAAAIAVVNEKAQNGLHERPGANA